MMNLSLAMATSLSMDVLARVALMLLLLFALVVVLGLFVALYDLMVGVGLVRAASNPPQRRTYCPLCMFAALPSDRWTPYAFAGDAVPCMAHRAEYEAMAHAWWTPESHETDTSDDVSEMETAEMPEVKAS